MPHRAAPNVSRPPLRRTRLGLVPFFMLGCADNGGTNPDGSGGQGGGSPQVCSAPAFGEGEATECAELSMCLNEAPRWSVASADCTGCSWSWTRDAMGDDQLGYDDGSSLYLWFSSLTFSETAEELKAKLLSLNAYVALPAAEGGIQNFASSQVQLRTKEELDAVELDVTDGVLRVSLSFESNPVTHVRSSTTICGDTNSCTCTFPDINAQTRVDVALPLPQ